MKRVLVTGGRDFALADSVHAILAPLHERFGLVELGEGGAVGADRLCRLWALCHGIPVATYEVDPKQWDLWGNRAGNMRNGSMLRAFRPDMAVAFPGADGTADMTEKLRVARIPTMVGRYVSVERAGVTWRLMRFDLL